MHFEHSVPPAKSPEVRLRLEEPAALSPDDATTAIKLLTELRHLLENGCSLTTAQDALDETEAALQTLVRPSAPAPGTDGAENLNLVQMQNQALKNAAAQIAQSNIVVLSRKSSRRMVRANRQELAALLDEVVQVAVQCCASAPSPRILRLRIHNDHRNYPSLIVEHSGNWTEPCKALKRQATGVEVFQNTARSTIALTFPNRV